MADESYEMFWDCPQCGTKELLGLTHRYCPTCGAPQDPDARYFPPEDRKVLAKDHVFAGADRVCPACDTPCSARVAFCPSCGHPLDEAKEVARRQDAVVGGERAGEPPAKAPAAPPRKGRGRAVGCVGCGAGLLVVALVVAVAAFLMRTRPETATVQAHAWKRAIAVEKYELARDAGWCDALPSGAKVTDRTKKKRSTRKVQDGQDCTTRNVDQGDGTYRQEKDCQPRYREEPVLDDWCAYTVPRWVVDRTREASGNGLSPAPAWPEVRVKKCGATRVGCEREGQRTSSYTLTLRFADGDTDTCEVPEGRWKSLKDGDSVEVERRVVTGGVDCDALR